ncbi:MAG: hypothetical protein LRY37_04360 [Alkalibacterium thalassium]|nr:hypothetical protein [Alkalibacterium thalassium]
MILRLRLLVKSFQEENDLDADGVVSGTTASVLIEALRELINENDTQYDRAVDFLLK